MVMGREIVRREQARLRALAEDARRGARQPAGDGAHPGRLRRVAFDRRFPQRQDLESRQCPLDAETTLLRLDEINVGRDAAAQRREANALSSSQQAHAADGLDELALMRERMILLANIVGAHVSLNRWR